MSNTVLYFACQAGQPTIGQIVNGSLVPLEPEDMVLSRGTTYDLWVTCYERTGLVDLSDAVTLRIGGKDSDDLDGDALVLSTTVDADESDLANGLIVFTDVSFGSSELTTALGTADDIVLALSIEELDISDARVRLLGQGQVIVVHDVMQGDESTPVYPGNIKHNTTATTAPTATDDSSEGYARGSIWIDGTAGIIYVCADATEDAAVWNVLTSDTLHAIAGLTGSADRLAYFTGSRAAALATLTSFARTLLDDDDAATARGTMGAAAAALLESGSVDIRSAADGTYVIEQRAAYAYTIDAIAIIATAGTCSVAVNIDGTPVVWNDALSVTTAELSTTAASANAVAAGATVTLVVSSAASLGNVAATFTTTRTP